MQKFKQYVKIITITQPTEKSFALTAFVINCLYSATTWTGPLRTKLTNQSVNWEQRMATLFVIGPMKLKNANNGLTTKICNPTQLWRVVNISETLSLFDWVVSILFFETFFDFSTFQMVLVNYKILTIFSAIAFAFNWYWIKCGANMIMVVDFPNCYKSIF